MPAPFTIRPARRDADEVADLQEIERRAGALFLTVDLPEIAADDPPTRAELVAAADLLVAVDGDDRPLGYARVEIVGGHVHLEQLSVDPAVGRQGIGAALLGAVAEVARDRGDDQVTLTTFRDVAFNAPYYERHGFEEVPERERSDALVELMAVEATHGLEPARRVAMRLRLDGGDVRPGGPRHPGR